MTQKKKFDGKSDRRIYIEDLTLCQRVLCVSNYITGFFPHARVVNLLLSSLWAGFTFRTELTGMDFV